MDDEVEPQKPVNPMGMIKNMAQNKFDPKMIAAISFAIILIITALGLGFGIMRNDPGEPTIAGTSGSITCNDWTSAPPTYQTVFTEAANKVNIQPALLGAIFLQENADAWRTEPWPTSSAGATGPFQFLPATWDGVKAGCGTENANNLSDAACGAAKLLATNLKNLVKAPTNTSSEQDIKDVAVSYTGSVAYFNKWVSGGRKDSDLNSAYISYHTNVWQYFQELNVGCVNDVSNTNKYKSISQIKMLYGSTESEVKKHIVTTTFMGKSVPVNKVLVAPLKKAEDQIKSTGANYTITDLSGFFWRVNANDPNKISMHSFGLAIDINPLDNPNGARPTDSEPRDSNKCTHKIPDNYVKALEDNGFFWGAKFKSYCDAMHFQYGGNAY